MILDWLIVAKNLDNYTMEKINKKKDFYKWKYVAFLLFSNNESSKTYVNMKQKKANKFWLLTKIIEKPDIQENEALKIINELNNDNNCIWILIQLPLNENIKNIQWKLLSSVHPKKDIDWLWWILFWLHQIWKINFLPATARAVFEILYFYKIWISWKNISVLWQSNLIWKPVTIEIINKLWTVFSFNSFSNKNTLKKLTYNSEIIISAANELLFIDKTYVNPNKMQVLIDVWRWKINNNPVWNFNFDDIFFNFNENNFMYTPVPWWVWPVTVSSIFANLVDLQDIDIYF